MANFLTLVKLTGRERGTGKLYTLEANPESVYSISDTDAIPGHTFIVLKGQTKEGNTIWHMVTGTVPEIKKKLLGHQ